MVSATRTSIAVVLLLVGGACSQAPGPTLKPDDCDVPGLAWMKVSNTYNRKTVANLAATLEAAAKADAEKIAKIAEGSISADLGATLANSSTVNREQSVDVSREFYEQSFAYRTAVCTLRSMLREGLLTGQASEEARTALVRLSTSFGQIRQKEESAPVRSDQSALDFGLSGEPRSIALRSSVSDVVSWEVGPSSAFDITPSAGVLEPKGSAVITVRPKRDLQPGKVQESLWILYRDSNTSERFSVTCSYVAPATLEYRMPVVDDQLILRSVASR